MKKTDRNQTEHFLFFSKNTVLSYNLNSFIDPNTNTVDIPTMEAKRKLSDQLNKIRLLNRSRKETDSIKSSHLNGMILIMETLLHVFHLYQRNHPDHGIEPIYSHIAEEIGESVFEESIRFYRNEFLRVTNNRIQNEKMVDYENLESASRIQTEEILMLWLANKNPAFVPFTDMFNDQILLNQSDYDKIISSMKQFLADIPAFSKNKQDIIDFLLEPSRRHPDSIFDQLNFIRSNWGDILGDFLLRLLRGMDLIKEEEKIGFMGPGKQAVLQYDDVNLKEERERFSPDTEWMPNLVLIAKTVYVWLYQLTKKYGYPIERLDQIPDRELDEMAEMGFSGLWLIGIWERSRASQKIKQICGNPEAISSAYSIFEYRVSDELGGESGLDNLKHRAAERGIRLGADMVPNHMGIDSNWVMEKPEHFIHLDHCPYPSHTFTGTDLSSREDIEIKIEDHYYDRTDAAVEFRWRDKKTGHTKYIYHGNDGTSMPWNDTAQLNYLIPEVREAAIKTILSVSRRFPIIRFDAAMTLTKLHYHRLWFPEPGSGGDIPTRSEHGMDKGAFSKAMGEEFWSEVVRRVAEESPDTLLLAEAFWLMEAYFVRTLGMHRVYNSAFMNFLKNEENSQFKNSIKNTIEFNPEILRRFVNFLNNPDEETAVAQFGKDDKYFGVTILVATLPGLPMFGHGQVEGLEEKYGMEYRRPYWDEEPDRWIVERHRREIFPLLKKRYCFSGVENFRLYDFYGHDGGINHDVIAYSNRFQNECSLIVYHNKFNTTSGWINIASPFLKNGGNGNGKQKVSENLVQNLCLTGGLNRYVIFRDFISGLEFIREIDSLQTDGLFIELEAFKYQVFLDFREVEDSESGIYRKLHDSLNGKGVSSIEEALVEMVFKPIVQCAEQLLFDIYTRYLQSDSSAKIKPMAGKEFEERVEELIRITAEITDSKYDCALISREIIEELIFLKEFDLPFADFTEFIKKEHHTFILLLLLVVDKLAFLAGKSPMFTLIISKIAADSMKRLEIRTDMNELAALFDALLVYREVLKSLHEKKREMDDQDILSFLKHPQIRIFLAVNRYNDIDWFNKERAEILLDWCYRLLIFDRSQHFKRKASQSDLALLEKYRDKAALLKEAIYKSEFQFKLLLKYISGYVEK